MMSAAPAEGRSSGWYQAPSSGTVSVGMETSSTRTVPPAVASRHAELVRVGRQRHRENRCRCLLGCCVPRPDSLLGLGTLVRRLLVAYDQEVAREERHDRVGEAHARRRVEPTDRDGYGVLLV